MGHQGLHQTISGDEDLGEVADIIAANLRHALPLNAIRTVGMDSDSIDIAIEDQRGNDWLITVRAPS